MFLKRNKNNKKIYNKNIKKECELTKEDYMLIDAHRKITGIYHYSDEYYYNNFIL